jgi:hypothetical protein
VTITVSTTDKRDGKALALFARYQDWQQAKLKDGRSVFAIPASEPGAFHFSNGRDCSCQDRQRSRNVCKHMRACRLWLAAYATGAVSPKRGDGATPEDDRIALTADGAALLVEQQAAPVAPTRYSVLFPSCIVDGCTGDQERGERYCPKHIVVSAF